MMADWQNALARAEAHSPFLSRAMGRLPDLVALLAAGDGEAALAYAREAGAKEADPAIALRREKLALALALGVGDLAGAFDLARVTGELTALADRALDKAIAHAIRARVPDAQATGFVALALGKQGAGELNYSSDIDPILIYDPQTLPRRPRDEPEEAAQHIARQILRIVSQVDAYGYVFRVDLRLRPASEISPLAIPLEGALAHYESSALAWERAAFIRARACAGDVALGEGFLHAIRPFVWRKSLDFGAIAEIGRLTRRIRAHHGKVERIGPGFDVKRGRGGIREVEFFAQVHQLIHGGRNPALRQRGTRATLDALAAAGLIAAEEAAMLGTSYDRLRQIEHRLQQVSDLQTHVLPRDEAGIANVAALDGLPNAAALIEELQHITEEVGAKYDSLIAASAGEGTSVAVPRGEPLVGEALAGELQKLGFADAGALAERIEGWRGGSLRVLRSEAALSALDAVQPALLAALAHAPAPEKALTRWEQMMASLPSAVNLFRLLEARPGLLEVMVRVLSLAPPLADALARRADLLDALIDASAYDLPPDVPTLAAEFGAVEAGDDYQRLLDHVRRKVSERRFALGVQLVEGAQDPLDISAGLCRVAEAALEVLARATMAEFEATHGRIAGAELVILGLGRFGGGSLTHASDLDLVYLFTGDFAAESDGRRPLGATLYFNRLAQRISAALTVPTAEGALFEVDTRLRPQGTQGPLAVSLDSFALYQSREAWTWEHMALTRARVLFGSAEARAVVEGVMREVLTAPRDRAKVLGEVREMRDKMAAHKPAKGALDGKLLRGGLVDAEFITHALQLSQGVALRPDMAGALQELVAAGLLPTEVEPAFALLSRLLVAARLLAPDSQLPDGAPWATLAKACGFADGESLLAAIGAARGVIAQAWFALFGQNLEVV
ncbi:bifunctional [glutamine synthetase] adenylyltransferase/[glutamine synthetase]-adenylyl-L-tyrosine phosphorylase [Novosphingobium umbonatum]|uniref:Bifunctional [glutamine synthetase] adenylyltransferase/[glutamine synthetase]-adenylyl-L-tyrosine phosphorylase n=1 Tax=Novosphingobium umbonatum TaxID=1908524 RepID=A0A3S2VD98_9SPHN|nr:bifunctional [glutamine synthetase] adenylyltransferase/[glutamine synthetase]-adenylyl-L-tyrosine phosphorylase [Novosphingobium umbonatum]RVU05074.1 bifunctional [glutamine synthetase] adenylyltransferase/[glutamine synthetase]-adenylyl-L-tyrosine phosphorylase [Novosphingobium umbonatum]